jgi:MFS transporter, DHA1 family, tetracycline resistance protein
MITIDSFGGGIMYPVYPLLISELTNQDISRAAIYGGWTITLFCSVQFFAAPLLGRLSDSLGRRPILLGSLVAFGANYLAIGLAPSVSWLFAGALLAGAFSATASTATAFVADVTPPEDRARRFGMIVAASGTGLMFGPMLAGALEKYGTRAPFFLAAGLALLNALCGFFMLPESLSHGERRPFFGLHAHRSSLSQLIKTFPSTAQFLIALALMQIAAYTVPLIWSYVTILKFGWSQAQIGLSLSLSAMATIVVQAILLKHLTQRAGIARSACVGLICTIISLLGFAFASRTWHMLAFIVPGALGSVTGSVLVAHISNLVPTRSQGELQGTIASIGSASATVTPLLMTQIFSLFTRRDTVVFFPGAPYVLAAIFATGGLLIVIYAFKRDRSLDSGFQFENSR